LSDDAAPSDYVRLGELSVTSGKGCGVLGEGGSREGAEAMLKNEAARLGASYVQVTSFQPPRPNHQCIEHEYKLSGVAYRSAAAGPAPADTGFIVPASAPLPATAPTTSAAPPPRAACVPGATQACLGPGACQGAQACREDASGFLPCDCGPAQP
jgi:hypothetical protein